MDESRGSVWEQIAKGAAGHPDRIERVQKLRSIESATPGVSDTAKRFLADLAFDYRLGELADITEPYSSRHNTKSEE